MPSQQEVDRYVEGAMHDVPVRDEAQLVSMVVLHFTDISVASAREKVIQSIKTLKPVFWNPHKFER